MRRSARGAGVLAAVMLLSGCSAIDSVSRELGGWTDEDLLYTVSLTEADAAQGALFEPYEGGDSVEGQASLDLCHAEFPSEGLRTGRNQVGIGQDQGENWVSSEAILYATPEDAQQAMGELEEAVKDCPTGPVESPGGDPQVWSFQDAPDADWAQEPGVTRQAYAFTVDTGNGRQFSSTATYLQRGRMVLALYVAPGDAPSTVIVNAPSPARFTEVMARRLASLPEDELQYGTPGEEPGDLSA